MNTPLYIEKSENGVTVLFIHGSGWNTHVWHNQRDYLMSSVQVVLLDLPGHGVSAGPACDSVEAYSESIRNSIAYHDIDACYVVGHSLGGAIAMSLAFNHPDLVRGLILIGSGARLKVLPQILDGVINRYEQTVDYITSLAFSLDASPELKKLSASEIMKCGRDSLYKDFVACDRFDMMDTVKSIKSPVLILCGANDTLTPPKYSIFLNRAMHDSELVFIEQAGHMAMLEKPVEVSKAIKTFIDKNLT